MDIIRGLHNLRPEHRGCVMTIGNYDGVHLGHQAILERLKAEGADRQLPVLATVFEPTPREFFDPATAPPRLSSLREKLEDLASQGVDRLLVLPFNRQLADLPAGEFVKRVIVNGLGARFLAVGDDFRFGSQRGGDFDLLCRMGAELGFEVQRQASEMINGQRASSSAVRAFLEQGDLQQASAMLGRGYRISARVQSGRKLGRTLGVPTANLSLGRRRAARPAARLGVYAVTIEGPQAASMQGVANLGFRPTVAGEACLLEVHLFDFEGDIYGQRLSVTLQHFLRDEQRFASVDELSKAMHADIGHARALLS